MKKQTRLSKKGGKGALSILDEFYISDPTEVDLETLICAKGGFVQTKPMRGAQGRIIIKNKKAIITINSSIQNKNKQRFVLAHEFGHFMLHSESINGYLCGIEDFIDWQGKRPEEAQANQFAANLLMPPNLFKEECKGYHFSIGNLQRLADRFQTSFMATAIRFAEYGNYPCAVIYSKDGIVKWATYSQDFPSLEYQLDYIEFESPVPFGTVAYDIFKTSQNIDEPFKVNAGSWFSKAYNLRHFDDWEFWEECFFYRSFNAVLSIVCTY